VRTYSLLFLFAYNLLAFGQGGNVSAPPADQPSIHAEEPPSTIRSPHPDELKQELDAYAIELSKIPADPLIQPDPVAPILRPIDKVAGSTIHSLDLKFGATYTFLNQYATTTPEGVRHDQPSGRLDFTGAWSVYDHETTAGSISLLIRSGTNIGISQQFNLSDRLGSGLYLNCLQGGGPQEPITVNILYWRQDFLKKRLSFYVGKIHPNEYVTLSMFNNDERTQFLNGTNDGNDAVASDGTYAGGGAVEFRLASMSSCTLSQWIPKAHSTEISNRWSIENMRKELKWAGPQVPLVESIGFIARACGETTPRIAGVDMAAALSSTMNCLMAGRRLEDLPLGPGPERPSKMNTSSGWLRFIHSDAGETCSARHSLTVNRTPLLSIMRACLSHFTDFVSRKVSNLGRIWKCQFIPPTQPGLTQRLFSGRECELSSNR
jgi:hypothetical protein